MHKHHIVARSRGGGEDEWNLIELSPYDHAYEHALDFVLFEHAPRFDFRHEAWGLLPEKLRSAVLEKTSEKMIGANNQIFGTTRPERTRAKISATRKLRGCGKGNTNAKGNRYSLTEQQKENRRRAANARPDVICPECGRKCKGKAGLARHLPTHF